MIRRLSVLALAMIAVLPGESYEIRPPVGTNAVPMLLYAPAPFGSSVLLYGGRRLALFTGDGWSVDHVWWKPSAKFHLAHKDGKAHVLARDWMKAGPAEFSFDKSGNLSTFSRHADGAQQEKDSAVIAPSGKISLKQYWPKPKPTGDFWRGTSRLRLGYKNPNAAGTLFAELAVLALAGVAFLPYLWMRIAAGGGILASLVALFLTESRGSFVGFCIGAILLAFIAAIQRFSAKRMVIWCGISVIAAGLLVFGALGDRFGKNLFERNEANEMRLECWRAAPAMMAAAPAGWGEKCGHAYCDWFQPVGNYHPQTWLFNSHLTWMVERGWIFRFAYCAGWLLVLTLLGAAARRSRVAGAAFAVWVAFAVALWFSTVGQCWTLWMAPVMIALAAVRSVRLRHVPVAATVAFALGGAICIMVAACGGKALERMPLRVHLADGITTVGEGKPKIWMLRDDRVMAMGLTGAFGHELRAFLSQNPTLGSIAVTDAAEKVPPEVDTLIAAGDAARKYMTARLLRMKAKQPNGAKRLVLLSPSFPTRAVAPSIAKLSDLLFLSGELVKPLYLKAGASVPAWARFVPGAEMYVPGWMDIAFKGGK